MASVEDLKYFDWQGTESENSRKIKQRDWSSGSAIEGWKQSQSTGPLAASEALGQKISQPFFHGNIHLNMLEHVDITQQLHFEEWRLLHWRIGGVFHTWNLSWLVGYP